MLEILSSLNNKQQTAVKATEGPVLVLAGAGSGKTRTLVHRIAYLIAEKRIKPWNIAAVTFTNKAANEIKERVRALLAGTGHRPAPAKGSSLENLNQQARGTKAAPTMGTFHSVCVRILRDDIEHLGYKRSFVIYDTYDKKAVIRRVMKEIGLGAKEIHPNKVSAIISSAKNQLQTPEQFKSTADSKIFETVAEIYGRYQRELEKSNALDFDDLIMKTVELLRKFPEVLKKYHERWKYILIDEYQDINFAQYTWSQLLAEKSKNIFAVGDDFQAIYAWRGADYRNILNFENDYPSAKVVLLEQNYRSTQNILELGNIVIRENKFQKEKVLWTQNKAGALPAAVEVENEYMEAEFVLSKIFGAGGCAAAVRAAGEEVVYDYESEGNPPCGRNAVLHAGASVNCRNRAALCSELPEKQDTEVRGILDTIIQQNRMGKGIGAVLGSNGILLFGVDIDADRKDINLNDYVVLYRTNTQSRVLEEVMLEYGVPYRLIGGIKFYERKEIKDIVAYLRLLHNPRDIVSLERVINAPKRGIGPKTIKDLVDFAAEQNLDFISACVRIKDFVQSTKTKPLNKFGVLMRDIKEKADSLLLEDIIDLVGNKTDYILSLDDGTDEGAARLENIKELKSAAYKYADTKGVKAVSAFLEEVALITDIDSYDASKPAVTLMTAHSAKGLEFPCVFMVGMEDGLFPHIASLYSPHELEEERRLCYVGITRAKHRLYFVHARARTLHGNTMFNLPSQFIRDLPDGLVERVYL